MLSDSDRLSLSILRVEDRKMSLEMSQNPLVMNYISGRALTLDEAEKRFKDQLLFNSKNPGLGYIKAMNKLTNKPIGYLKMAKMEPGTLEIGYGILPQFWGQGYASEMLKVILNYTPTLKNFHTLVGVVHPDNLASIKVLSKHNFTLKDEVYIDNIKVAHYKKPNK
jgi:ribosomal-protein-alanine N-acetyltransferase